MRKELDTFGSYDTFKWALRIVHSRALALPLGGFAGRWRKRDRFCEGRWFALVSLVNLVYHGIGIGIVSVRFNEHGKYFEVLTGKKRYGNGGQVFVCYVALPSDELY